MTVNITINGQKIQAKEGTTVLEAATEAGIKIPTLCHHPALAPIGACRVCLFEITKQQPLHPACTYPVVEGLVVDTTSPRVVNTRRFVLEMLFSERNHYCMFCEMSGNCELQDLGYMHGLDHWTYPTYTERFPVDASRDTFLMDHNRCVLCRRCVRACGELVGNHTLGMRLRGANTMISADMNVPFGDSSCVECGTCLQVCPTGSLIDKRNAYMDQGYRVELRRVKSTCTQCSVGCGLQVVTRGGNILRIEGDWDAKVNGGLLCQKGRFAPLYDQRQRISAPLLRRDGRLQPATWDEALAATARGLARPTAKGAGVLASSHATSEALYLIKRLFVDELGIRQIGLLDAAAVAGQQRGKLEQISSADMVLVVGANPVKDQPVVSFLIKRAVDKGARLVVVDDDQDNGLLPFAHTTFPLSEMRYAVDMAARADAPVVLVGGGLACEDLVVFAGLERAVLVTLQPGVNSVGAAVCGLAQGTAGAAADALFVLLGEALWTGQAPVSASAFLAVQACYQSSLTDLADVVLPMTIWSESSGTTVNLEGRRLPVRPATDPAGEARPDWEILSLLARELGVDLGLSQAELAALAVRGIS